MHVYLLNKSIEKQRFNIFCIASKEFVFGANEKGNYICTNFLKNTFIYI